MSLIEQPTSTPLPYDVARCNGIAGDERCQQCRRRESGRDGYQVYIAPPQDIFECENFIGGEQ